MAFSVSDVVVVDADGLLRDQFVGGDVHAPGQQTVKAFGHLASQRDRGVRTGQAPDRSGRRHVEQVAFVLFVEFGRDQPPRGFGLQPIQPPEGRRRQLASTNEVLEGPLAEGDRIQLRKHRPRPARRPASQRAPRARMRAMACRMSTVWSLQ